MITGDDIERVKDAVRATQEVRSERREGDSGFVALLREFEELGLSVMSGMDRRSQGGGQSFSGSDDRTARIREGLRASERVRRELSGNDEVFFRLLGEFENAGLSVMSGIERRYSTPSPGGWG